MRCACEDARNNSYACVRTLSDSDNRGTGNSYNFGLGDLDDDEFAQGFGHALPTDLVALDDLGGGSQQSDQAGSNSVGSRRRRQRTATAAAKQSAVAE